MANPKLDRIIVQKGKDGWTNLGGLTAWRRRHLLCRGRGGQGSPLCRLADEPDELEGLPEETDEIGDRAFVESFRRNQMMPKRRLRGKVAPIFFPQFAVETGEAGSLSDQPLPFGRRFPLVRQDVDCPLREPCLPV